MDTSEIYVEMCEKATEIQEIWNPYYSDEIAYFDMKNNRHWLKGTTIYERRGTKKDYKTIWLPRQDQLQDMICKFPVPFVLFRTFIKKDYITNEYVKVTLDMKEPYYPINIFKSMEQVWLAFVMKEKYNKKWIDNEWK